MAEMGERRRHIHPMIIGCAVLIMTRGLGALLWNASAQQSALVLGMVAAADILLMALSAIVIWRAADADRNSPLTFLAKSSILAISAWVSTQALNQLANKLGPPPQTAQTTLMLPVHDAIARVSGPIDFDTFDRLQATLAAHPKVHTLSFDSPGGRIPAARGLARLISEAALNTHVTGTCASACTLAFIAGGTRTMDPGAQIGFHGYALLSTVQTLDISHEQSRDIARFERQGVAADFLEHAYSVPHTDIWFPSSQDLIDAGVLTKASR